MRNIRLLVDVSLPLMLEKGGSFSYDLCQPVCWCRGIFHLTPNFAQSAALKVCPAHQTNIVCNGIQNSENISSVTILMNVWLAEPSSDPVLRTVESIRDLNASSLKSHYFPSTEKD